MIVKDAMVIIHLGKITLLEKSCQYFENVSLPKKVYEEVTRKEEVHPEVKIIKDLVEKNKMKVIDVRKRDKIEKANQFNIQDGEAEAVALYWQEEADYLATDDDNVRKKGSLLDIKIIGTPAIILKLYKENAMKERKFRNSLEHLRKIGWFSDAIIDKILMEV